MNEATSLHARLVGYDAGDKKRVCKSGYIDKFNNMR